MTVFTKVLRLLNLRKASDAGRKPIQIGIRDYPIKKMTRAELEKLPRITATNYNFPDTSPLGTWFVCKTNRFEPEITVVGHIVKSEDLFLDQDGVSMSVPNRGFNRYRVELTD